LIAADANKQRSVPNRQWKPEEVRETATRATQEYLYLATHDDAVFGSASPVTPKFISRSDPGVQWAGAHKGRASSPMPTRVAVTVRKSAEVSDLAVGREARASIQLEVTRDLEA
jgi:hypothetical protein